jgi:hypothetical protein
MPGRSMTVVVLSDSMFQAQCDTRKWDESEADCHRPPPDGPGPRTRGKARKLMGAVKVPMTSI